MAVSTADLIPRVRDLLGDRPWQTTGTAADASTTSVTVPDGTRWAAGNVGEFQDNGEQVLVSSVAGNTLTVVRGYAGTTAQAHSSIALVRDPTYTYRQVLQALTWAVQNLWPYAWKTETISITPDATKDWYDASTTAIDVVRVSQRYGSSNQYLGIFGSEGSGKPVEFARNLPTALVASGSGFRFPRGFFHGSNAVTAVMRARITGTADIPDGSPSVADAVVLGACYRVVLGTQTQRTGTEVRADVLDGVQGSDRARTALLWKQEWQQALLRVRAECAALYPPAGKA
jgi:hypothetical protein